MDNYEDLNHLIFRKELIESDVRYQAFQKAIRFANYELIDGDVFEFGVYTGRSLALLQIAHEDYVKTCIHKINFTRDFIGFDSFKGMHATHHPRWEDGTFSVNHSWHPTIKTGEPVLKEKVLDFFKVLKLASPIIVEGYFDESLEKFLSNYAKKAAIAHIDCDSYENTILVLKNLKPVLQEGTIIMFDDWFNYKGSPHHGEARAFTEFRKDCNEFSFVDYFNYGTFCKSFIATKNPIF